MMKKLLFLNLMLLIGLNSVFAQKAIISDSWIQTGSQITAVVKLKTIDALGKNLTVAVYFCDVDGNPLKDNNGKFRSNNGQIAMYTTIKPGYNEAYYDNLLITMPNTELDLSNVENKRLMYVIEVYYGSTFISGESHINNFLCSYRRVRCPKCNGSGTFYLFGEYPDQCMGCYGSGVNVDCAIYCQNASPEYATSEGRKSYSTNGQTLDLRFDPNFVPSTHSNSSSSSSNSRQCYACKGTGTTKSYRNGPSSGPNKCSTCGDIDPAGRTHIHIRCTSCGGTGYSK